MAELNQKISGHLLDLKNLLIKVLFTWLVGVGVSFYLKDKVLFFYFEPVRDAGIEVLNWLGPMEKMTILMKIHFFTGFIFVLPLIALYVWNFVSPALKLKEKAFATSYFIASFFLTFIGVLYGYYWIVPFSLRFFNSIMIEGTSDSFTVVKYMDFFTTLLLALIMVFQIPILVFLLTRSGLIKSELIVKYKKYIYFLLMGSLFVLIPGDLTLSVFIVLPVFFLFELALFLGKVGKKPKPPEEDDTGEVDVIETTVTDVGYQNNSDQNTVDYRIKE